ncbi:hypothetical protein B0J14DRAFT_608241 [Halenospora varia]|nr:hypothetical protein B0J14DRAFT_608241 [Halenospora varia]
MSFLTKAARPSKRSAIHIFKHNTFRSCAAMSTISDAIKKDHQEIKEYAENIRTATDDDSKTLTPIGVELEATGIRGRHVTRS